MQIIIVLLVSLASVGIFMYFKPYIHEMDSNLAIMAQWSITLVLISGECFCLLDVVLRTNLESNCDVLTAD